MYTLIRQALFSQDPETAHKTTMRLLDTAQRMGALKIMLPKVPSMPVTVAGITFPNPIGLAAGFDKDALHVNIWKAIGFGHVEIGTVTPRPQPGNPQPRLFRLPSDNALINRMGFNNQGVDVAAARLANRPAGIVVGGNIGKNKDTVPEDAPADYAYCAKVLAKVVDYLTVNVSSPNTPGLRDLQSVDALKEILKAVEDALYFAGRPTLPVFVKVAPDLANEDLIEIAKLAVERKLAGLVATNTTISRAGLRTEHSQVEHIGAGGLSGAPLRKRSVKVLKLLRGALPDSMAVISSGGIDSVEAIAERVAAGANLVQLYTGFIYRGPKLIADGVKAFQGH